MVSRIRLASAQHRLALGITLLSLLLCPTAWAKDSKEGDEIDYLELAGRLLADDHIDRAAGALANVKPQAEGTDRHRYYLLQGLIALRQQRFEEASAGFDKAIKIPPQDLQGADEDDEKQKKYSVDPRLFLYLAQAEFGLKHYEKVLSAIKRAGKGLDADAGAYMLRSQAEWELKKPSDALATLARAAKRFPDDSRFERLQVFYLIDLNLFQAATAIGQKYLNREGTTAEDYVAIGEALRRGKQFEKAATVLEAAHLRFPHDDNLSLALAHAQLELDQRFAAAMILEDAARLDPSYTVQAAEMYRQAKRSERALYLNAQVPDQKAKFKQRLAILLDKEEYQLVAGMAPTVKRLGLIDDDQIRYAMAFGFYKIGDRKQAEHYLKGIADPKLFENANGLRKAMQACPEDSWECQ